MKINNDNGITEKNLDYLAELLNQERNQSNFTVQIPSEAHIFYGSYHDTNLTQGNLELAARVMLGMALGYVDEAPLVMVFEHEPSKKMLIHLSNQAQKHQVQAFIDKFREENQRAMFAKINEPIAA
jgi:hypothetical protein